MRKITFAVLFMVMAVAPYASPQKHAQTEEQCEADAKSWGEEEEINTQTVDELRLRINEMRSCGEAYPRGQIMRFLQALVMSEVSLQEREQDFISRHNLYWQFQEEDRAGKR